MSSHLSLPKVYSSAVDLWVAVLLLLGPFLSAVAGGYALWMGKADDAFLLFLAGAGVAGLTTLLVFPCRYTLTDDSLAIRCGILISRVKWEDVVSAEPSRTLRSGPSLSLCRVVIKAKSPGSDRVKAIVISPRDRDDFLSDVHQLLGENGEITDN